MTTNLTYYDFEAALNSFRSFTDSIFDNVHLELIKLFVLHLRKRIFPLLKIWEKKGVSSNLEDANIVSFSRSEIEPFVETPVESFFCPPQGRSSPRSNSINSWSCQRTYLLKVNLATEPTDGPSIWSSPWEKYGIDRVVRKKMTHSKISASLWNKSNHKRNIYILYIL